MKKIFATLITVLLLLSACQKVQDVPKEERSFEMPLYYHYTGTDTFLKKCEELISLATNNHKKAFSLYEELYEELVIQEDNYAIADLNYNQNLKDESLKEEKEYTFDSCLKIEDQFCLACHYYATGPLKDEFKEALNNDKLFDYYAEYEELSEEQKELLVKEQELINEYYVATDALFGDEYIETCGEIFVQLVKIRDRLAKLNGYDNFNEYADREYYCRDYDKDDLKDLYAAVKEFKDEYLIEYALAYTHIPEHEKTGKAFVNAAKPYIEKISPLLKEAYEVFVDHELYFIDDDKSYLDAGYTNCLEHDHIPFIFLKTHGSARDITTLFHEFGHFVYFYNNYADSIFTNDGCYDVYEIHSTGLQLLGNDYYGKIAKNADMIAPYNVLTLLTYLTDGCIYDEWQRIVYDDPDMTIDEINRAFVNVYEQYSTVDASSLAYDWCYITHNFDSPLYYISYATSAYASLQIFAKSLSDHDAGVEVWENIVNIPAEKGYKYVIKQSGLEYFDDKDVILKILDNAYEYSKKTLLDLGYSRKELGFR